VLVAQLSVDKETRKKLKHSFKTLQKKNLAIDLVSATSLSHKITAAVTLGAFPSESAEADLDEIRQLRNSVAHAWEYGYKPAEAKCVPQRVRLLRRYIRLLQKQLANTTDKPHAPSS
jgi:hypothetical protein